VQLGELQNQIDRFDRRDVTVLGLSVDEPQASLNMIDRLGLSFDLGSDPEQDVIKAFRVQNPDTRELAIHAVYILDAQGRVLYRKVGGRRPVSQELIDAIDASRDDYPRTDEEVASRQRVNVAYPRNNFQALLGISAVESLPASVDAQGFARVMRLMSEASSDDALVAFKSLVAGSTDATEQDLLDTAAWLTRQRFFSDNAAAIETGELLTWRLNRIQELEATLKASASADDREELLQTLARARAGLSMTRADIDRNAEAWNLRYAKTTLRSYREVALAGLRIRDESSERRRETEQTD
jgi:hypothetical protein